jgi:hypothetical protein
LDSGWQRVWFEISKHAEILKDSQRVSKSDAIVFGLVGLKGLWYFFLKKDRELDWLGYQSFTTCN